MLKTIESHSSAIPWQQNRLEAAGPSAVHHILKLLCSILHSPVQYKTEQSNSSGGIISSPSHLEILVQPTPLACAIQDGTEQ
mmetsp:Transcript_29197/g.58728  ORF Transcript_29197/g.58728 Transcript_29197/m.58728 type:complete len:82 (-) Transcript_29197:801-1046(-)